MPPLTTFQNRFKGLRNLWAMVSCEMAVAEVGPLARLKKTKRLTSAAFKENPFAAVWQLFFKEVASPHNFFSVTSGVLLDSE